jgi:hypothetical protein
MCKKGLLRNLAIRRVPRLDALAAVMGATVLAASVEQQEKAAPSQHDELIQKASYVSIGTVRLVGASNVKLIPGGDDTAVVHIDHIAKGADTVGDFTGDDVTVVLQKPKSVAVGDRFHFYTNRKVSGANLAVDEVGRTPIVAGEEVGAVKARAAQMKTEAGIKKVEAHTTDADLIVTGKVTAIKPVPRDERHLRSEHDPDWWEATVAVDSTEKGQAPANNVLTVYYPFSRDIRWFRVPKLVVGREGVFFLHAKLKPGAPAKGEEHEADTDEVKGYKILHVEDLQPVTTRDQVRTMLRKAK